LKIPKKTLWATKNTFVGHVWPAGCMFETPALYPHIYYFFRENRWT